MTMSRSPSPSMLIGILLAASTIGFLLVASTIGCSPVAIQPTPELPFRIVEGARMYDVVPMDAIPAIDAPVFVPAEEADDFLLPDEPVLGVVGGDGTAKAYSAWQLERHEIVNDVLDGEPIAATW